MAGNVPVVLMITRLKPVEGVRLPPRPTPASPPLTPYRSPPGVKAKAPISGLSLTGPLSMPTDVGVPSEVLRFHNGPAAPRPAKYKVPPEFEARPLPWVLYPEVPTKVAWPMVGPGVRSIVAKQSVFGCCAFNCDCSQP